MRRTLTAALVVLFAAHVGTANAQQAKLEKVNIAFAFAASSTLHLWIAKEEGLFQKHGLDAKLIYFRGSPAATQGLLGGSVDIVFGSAAAAITATGRGAPVAVIATTRLLDYMLMTRADTTDVKQLRGRSVGISNHSGGDDFALRRLLPQFGLKPMKDVRFVVLGTPNPYKKAEAVLNGTTDGTLITAEVADTLRFRGKKINILAEVIPRGIKLSVGDIFTTRKYLDENPERVKRFMRAFVEAIRMAKNDKALVFKTLRKHTYTKKAEILEKVYKNTIVASFLDVPYPHVEAIETQRDDISTTSGLGKLKGMSIDRFVDNGPLEALEREGFFKKLPPLAPQ